MSVTGDVSAQDHEEGPFQEAAAAALSGVGTPLFCEFLAFIAVVEIITLACYSTLAQRKKRKGKVADAWIDKLEPIATTQAGPGALEEIFAEAGRDRMTAAGKALAYLQSGRDAQPLIDAARRLVFLKGDDPHDYKFSSAVLEDYSQASPAWRDRYLASSLLLLPRPADKDNSLVQRTRAALEA